MSNAPGSGSGSGSTTTAQDASNSSPDASPQASGSGSGSDSGAGTGGGGGCTNYNTFVAFGQAGPADVTEEANPCGPVSYTVPIYVSYPGNCPVSVDWYTLDGTAQAGIDYTEERGTANFAAGANGNYTVTIPILDDGNDESVGSDYFKVTLANPVNATLGEEYYVTVNIQEGPQEGPTDTLIWNPCPNGNYDASDPTNWYDATQGFQLQKGAPGPGPGNPIIFDGMPTSQTPDDDEPITWDDPKLPSWTLEKGYNKLETINAGDAIELTGDASGISLYMDGTS